MKDLQTESVILRYDSTGDLYPILPMAPPVQHALAAPSCSEATWHRRLGHPGHQALSRLATSDAILFNKNKCDTSLCHACRLGRHVRLPFYSSLSRASKAFDLIHCDLWTSPMPSISGFKYYLVCLDDYTHFLRTFPLKLKSNTFATIKHF